MSLLMDFDNEDSSNQNSNDLAPFEMPSGYEQADPTDAQLEQNLIKDDTPKNQSFDMPELNVEGKVNRLYDYDKELRLLKNYAGDIAEQPEKDAAGENTIRASLANISRSKLSDAQLEDIQRKEADARMIGGIFGSVPNVFFANGQQRSLGENPFPNLVKGWIDNANAPLRRSEYKANEYQKEATNRKILSDVERQNLAARGKDLENFSSSNKQILSTIDTKQKADPSSEISKQARELAMQAIEEDEAYAKLPAAMGGETRQRYREIAPYLAKMKKALIGASFDDTTRVNKLIADKKKELGVRANEDIREAGYELQARKLGAMLSQGNPAANKAAAETGAEVAEQQDAINAMMRVYELAQDPEIQKGFGTMTLGRIMDMARQDLSPKQIEFQQLVAYANSEIIKKKYGSNFTGREENVAYQFLPTPENSISTLLPKVSGMNQMAAKGLFNSFGKHYGLTTGREFGRDFGIKYDPENRQFSASDIQKMRNLSPWSMLPPRGSSGNGKKAYIEEIKKGNAEPAVKILTDADIDKIMQDPRYANKTKEQIIKEATGKHSYVYKP